jgi:hypothetical protein
VIVGQGGHVRAVRRVGDRGPIKRRRILTGQCSNKYCSLFATSVVLAGGSREISANNGQCSTIERTIPLFNNPATIVDRDDFVINSVKENCLLLPHNVVIYLLMSFYLSCQKLPIQVIFCYILVNLNLIEEAMITNLNLGTLIRLS